MNKSELIDAISSKSGLTKADSSRALTALIDSVTDTLSSGGNVAITGFGSFLVRDRSARTGRNPQTGATINIAASKVPAFKAGKLLKESVN